MKRGLVLDVVYMLIIVMVMGVTVIFSQSEKIPEPQKFQVTYTVVYNAITLDEAAAKEKDIKSKHKDACKISLSLKEAQGDFSTGFGTVSRLCGDGGTV